MVCKPAKFKGLLMGILLGVFFFGTVIWGVKYALGPEDRLFEIVLLGPAYLFLLAFIVIWLGLATMKYKAEEDGLVISWLYKRYTIPWSDITELIKVSGRLNLISFLGVSWPGYIAGTYDIKGIATSKVFGSDLDQLLIIKAGPIAYGITPSDEFIQLIAERSHREVTPLDTYDLPDDVIGKMINEDLIYLGLQAINILVIVFLMIYLAIFFPGSGANPRIILLLVLALGIFVFNMINASRLFHYVPMAAYLLWLVGVIINIAFMVISMSVVGFGF